MRTLSYYWTVISAYFRLRNFMRSGQFGDGREERCIQHVLNTAPQGDARAALAAYESFAEKEAWLPNVGEAKGAILSEAVKTRAPLRTLELGTHLGYGAVSIAIDMPSESKGMLVTVETSAANAALARLFIAHAGLSDAIQVVEGRVQDVLESLRREGAGAPDVEPFDLVFIDHDKNAYLDDLRYLMTEKLVVKGSVIVADNILFPGAPEYRKFVMQPPRSASETTAATADRAGAEAAAFETTEHFVNLEHLPFIKDCVTVSTLLA